MNTKTKSPARILAASALALLASFSPSRSATNTFQAGTSWDIAADWTLGHVPIGTDALLFDHSVLGVVPGSTLDNTFTAQTLSFDTGADVFGIDANASGSTARTLTLTGGTNALGTSDLIALSSTTTGTLTLGGIAGVGSLNLALGTNGTFNVANAAANLVFGPNAFISGAFDLTKTGAGALTLAGVNTYTKNTFVNAGTLHIDGVINTPTADLQVDGSTVDAALASLGSGGSLTARWGFIGRSGNGTFTQTGGTHTILNSYYGLQLGFDAGSSGSYTLSGTGMLSAPSETVGFHGSGIFIQSGGTNTVSDGFLIGREPGSSGSYTQSGGSNTVSQGTLFLGAEPGSSGSYALSGTGTMLSAPIEVVGSNGSGTFTQSGGSNTAVQLALGIYTGSSGTYTLSGTGSMLTAELETVGCLGNGTFTQSGGTNTVYGLSGLSIGGDVGGSGSYTLSGTGILSAPYEYVGSGGSGIFNQSGGTNTVNDGLYLGAFDIAAIGSYILSGAGTMLSAVDEYMGYFGTGAFIQNGGTNTLSNTLYLGHDPGSNGSYALNAGLLRARAVSGGTGTSTFNFNGGTLQAAANNAGFMGGLTTAKVQAGGARIDTDGRNVTMRQPLVHDAALGVTPDGGLLKTASAGALTLTAASTFTGPTSIDGGTLILDNDPGASTAGQLATTGAVAIHTGATLLLSGSSGVTDRLNDAALIELAGGILNTGGLSEGTSAVAGVGELILSASSILDLGNGASIFHFADSHLAAWTIGEMLTIVNWSGTPIVGGGTDQLFFGSDPSALASDQVDQIQFDVGSGQFFPGVLLADGEFVPVPEPTAAVLIAAALLGLSGRRARRRL